jgi:hypothetical protein
MTVVVSFTLRPHYPSGKIPGIPGIKIMWPWDHCRGLARKQMMSRQNPTGITNPIERFPYSSLHGVSKCKKNWVSSRYGHVTSSCIQARVHCVRLWWQNHLAPQTTKKLEFTSSGFQLVSTASQWRQDITQRIIYLLESVTYLCFLLLPRANSHNGCPII